MIERRSSARLGRFAGYLMAVAVALYCAGLPILKYSGRGYRDDETWAILRSMNTPSRIVELLLLDVKPPLYYIVLSGWMQITGHHEVLTGALSSLIMLLTMAFTYQLGRGLFSRAAGLWGALMLGLLPLIQHYGHETNTYSLLLMGTAGTSAAFVWWLRTGRGRYALVYVVVGLILTFAHYYGVFVILAHALFSLIFVRWRERMLLRAWSLFAALGIGFTGAWGLVIAHNLAGYRLGGGNQFFEGGILALLTYVYIQFQSRPTGVLAITALFGLIGAVPTFAADRHLRGRGWWRRGFLLIAAFGVLGIALALNSVSPSVTDRNLIVMLPFIAMLSGLGITQLPRRLQAVLLLFVGTAAVTTYWESDNRRTYIEIPGFMADDYQTGDAIVLDFDARADQIAATYYTRLRQASGIEVPPDDLYHILGRSEYNRVRDVFPQPMGSVAQNRDPETLAAFRDYLGGRDQVWQFRVRAQGHSEAISGVIGEDFGVYQALTLMPDISATHWRRLPTDPPDFYFDGDIVMRDWTIATGYTVAACERVTVESWWYATRPLVENTGYSMGMKLLKPDGSVLVNQDNQLSIVPSNQWTVGRSYRELSQVIVPCDTPAGSYAILMLVYDSATPDDALSVSTTGDASSGDTWAYLTNVEVVRAR